MSEPKAQRHVTLRDGRLEGEPDVEASVDAAPREERAMKETQRDLTSLSGPVSSSEERRARGTPGAKGRDVNYK